MVGNFSKRLEPYGVKVLLERGCSAAASPAAWRCTGSGLRMRVTAPLICKP